jgi:hypothetical protein
MSKDELITELVSPTAKQRLRSRFRVMAALHVCTMAGVAIICLNLVH